MSPDQLNDLRRRVLAGEKVSDEERREAIAALRQGRTTVAATSKSKKVRADVPLDDILGKLGL